MIKTIVSANLVFVLLLLLASLTSIFLKEELPPTVVAENLAYSKYADKCPRGWPRSDECKKLFAKVERDYLATH